MFKLTFYVNRQYSTG